MSESIFSYVPHLLFLGAQTSCGIMVMGLSAPPVVGLLKAATAGRAATYYDLVSSYPVVWQVMFGVSWPQLVLLGLIGLMVGMVFAECFYRLAILVGYHEEFSRDRDNAENAKKAEKAKKAVEEFKTLCDILEDPALHRMYEWENLQSSFVYYVEGNFWSLAFVVLVCGLIVAFLGCPACDVWFYVAVIELAAAILLAILMRHARIKKYEAFKNAYQAIKEMLVT